VENTVNANALVSVRNAVGRSWNDLPSSPEESTVLRVLKPGLDLYQGHSRAY
jgi:hypothetical protein